jgi:serine/threonine protein kinase
MTAPQLAAEQAAREEFVDELKPGTKLLQGQYTITRFINSGGFGITYLAKDSLDRDVVIKECFPGNFCRRSDTIVGARSRAHQAEFRSIVKLFVQEARSLAKLAHPNIVGVHQVFEDNDTAYMAIDFIDGRDLLDMIEDPTIEMTPSKIVSMTHKLLAAVGFIHDSGILHRDISPDNILINKKGEPILIDFGAAREEATRASRALSALRVVKDGYSPQEFYIAGSEQGPWSDLYALAATLYHTITGEPPANSQVRLAAIAEGNSDPYEALAGRFTGYPLGFLDAIDKALNAVPRRRIQNAGEWLEMLANPSQQIRNADPLVAVSRLLSEQTLESEVQVVLPEPQVSEPEVTSAPAARQPEPAAAPEPAGEPEIRNDAGAEAAAAPVAQAPVQPTRISSKPQPQPLPPARGGSGRGLLMGLSAVAVLAVLGYFVLGMDAADTRVTPSVPAPETTSPTAPAPVEEASVAPVAEPVPAVTEAAEAEATDAPLPQETSAGTGISANATEEPQAPVDAAAETPAAAASTDPAEVASAPSANDAPTEPAPVATAVEDRAETVAAAAALDGAADAPVAEPAEPAVAVAEPVVAATEPAPVEPAATAAPAETEAPVAEVDAAAEATTTAEGESTAVETATAEPPAAEVPVADPAVPAEAQVALAVWDVTVPFEAHVRTIGGVNYATIRAVDETADFSIAGDWIREGTTIFSVNGNPVSPSQNVGALILRNLTVERDGMARASVRIKLPGDSQYNRVQLAVPVLRRVSLAGGLVTEARFEGDRWRVVVKATGSAPTTLREGDVILSETLTGTALVHADSLEDAVGRLASEGETVAQFEIERGGAKSSATYALATK